MYECLLTLGYGQSEDGPVTTWAVCVSLPMSLNRMLWLFYNRQYVLRQYVAFQFGNSTASQYSLRAVLKVYFLSFHQTKQHILAHSNMFVCVCHACITPLAHTYLVCIFCKDTQNEIIKWKRVRFSFSKQFISNSLVLNWCPLGHNYLVVFFLLN